jgi:hypothetical protein
MIIIETYRGPLHGVMLWVTDNGDYAVHSFNVEEAVSLGWSPGLSSGDYFGPDRRKDAHDRWAERVEQLRHCLDGDLRELGEKQAKRAVLEASHVSPEKADSPDHLDLIGETLPSLRGDK